MEWDVPDGGNSPPRFTSNPTWAAPATAGVPYAASLAANVVDPDAGDVLSFAIVSGPPWLQVSSDGRLSGTPAFSDVGTQLALVRVSDSLGASAEGTVRIPVGTGSGTIPRLQLFRPETGTWVPVPGAGVRYGQAGDIPLPGVFSGAGKLAVWRPSNGNWYVRGTTAPIQYGQAGDVPVPGDYDGDGDVDLAVWRRSNASWYIRGVTPAGSPIQYGLSGDVPVPGDYDGDGKTDIAVWRPANGSWYLRGITPAGSPIQYGQNGDIPVPGDYNDDDDRTDIAVWRPANGSWYIRGVTPAGSPIQYGQSGDLPVQADYDGDGDVDIAVWRPGNATWYVRNQRNIPWGVATDVPATTVLNRKQLEAVGLYP